jgi:transcriptional regulator with XRE-family HTH domain
LGWTQQEIADKTGLDQSVVSRIMQNTEIGKIHNFIDDQFKTTL